MPKADSGWELANLFFKSELSTSDINRDNLNETIALMNSTIYNCFAENYGTVEMDNKKDNDLHEKYGEFSVNNLKKELKKLKRSNSDLRTIKFVSKRIRSKLKNNSEEPVNKRKDAIYAADHDAFLKHSAVWIHAKKFLNTSNNILPSFNKEVCTTYFKKVLRKIMPNVFFRTPSWIPRFEPPSSSFNTKPPTYRKVTNVIKRMKSSGCPCPLHQISILVFKHCPHLQSYLTTLLEQVWEFGKIPEVWKKATTILIHKKESCEDPANFRPITLESVPLKILASLIRNKMFSFLSENKYVEHEVQKGFTPKVLGTFEHPSQMAYLINHARIKQRSLVITLLDLKNAFGEVHHSLITEVLNYHHMLEEIQKLISSLYTGFHTSVITKSFATPFIVVGRGVLQGDPLSPLTFNLIFNTLLDISNQNNSSRLDTVTVIS